MPYYGHAFLYSLVPILPPQRMLSARFGRQSSMDSIGAESQAFNLDLDDIAEEDGEENSA